MPITPRVSWDSHWWFWKFYLFVCIRLCTLQVTSRRSYIYSNIYVHNDPKGFLVTIIMAYPSMSFFYWHLRIYESFRKLILNFNYWMFCLKLRECLIPLRCHIQYVSDLFREDPGDDQVTWSPTVSQNDKKLRVTENLNFWDILEKTISDRIHWDNNSQPTSWVNPTVLEFT